MYGDISSDKPIEFSPLKESLEKSLENLSESLTVSDDLYEEENNLKERKDTVGTNLVHHLILFQQYQYL